jgi:hypothetical protein
MHIVPWKRGPRGPATSGRIPQVPLKTTAVAQAGPLSLWRADHGVEPVSGVELSELEPNTLLELQTAGSRYRLVVRDPACGEVLIQGGRCFPRYTVVRLRGTGLGVSPVKTGWIGLGLGVEIMWDDLRIITAPVHAIRRQARPASRSLTGRLAA